MRHRHSVTENPGQLAIIATVAAVVGAVTALLVAPKNSDKLRESLRRGMTSVKDAVVSQSDAADDVQQTLDKTKARVKSTAAKVSSDAKSTAKKIKEDTKQTSKDAKAVKDNSKKS